jgi:hypothetical protein
MNKRFQTHSHSLCVSHSNLDLPIRNRIRKRNRMGVLGKVRSIGLLHSTIYRTLELSTLQRTL